MRRITLLLILCTLALLVAAQLRDRPHARAAPRAGADRLEVVRWQGVSVQVPDTWKRVTAPRGQALWVAPRRAGTVALVAPAAELRAPLAHIVGASARQLPTQVPAVRDSRIAALSHDGAAAIRHDFVVGPAERPIAVRQIWRRDAARARDVVVTYTWAGRGRLPRWMDRVPVLAPQ